MVNIYKPPFYKTTEIFGEIVGKKLELRIHENEERCYTDGKNIVVGLKSAETQDEIYGFLEHELAHIVFHSDVRNLEKFIKVYPSEMRDIAMKVFNIVEDHRVESCWGKIYAGSANRFDRLKRKYVLRTIPQTLLEVLLAVRADRWDLIPEEYMDIAKTFTGYLKKVEGRTAKATFIVARKIMEIISETLTQKESQKSQPQSESGLKDKGSEDKGPEEALEDMDKGSQEDEGGGKDRREENKGEDFSEVQKNIMREVELDARYVPLDRTQLDIKTRECKLDASKDEEEILQEAEEEMNKLIENVKEKLYQETHSPPEDAGIVGKIITKDVYGWLKAKIEPEMGVVSGLRRAFTRIKGKMKVVETEEGVEIDIDNYIQRKSNPNVQEIFQVEESSTGLNIILLLDISRSMGLLKLLEAKKILLTLYHAIRGISGINLEIYGFSGSSYSPYVTPVVKLDVERIMTIIPSEAYPYTHTYDAVKYCGNVLKKKVGKKLLIILTDGKPEAERLGEELARKYTSIAIEKVRQEGIKVYTIMVSPPTSQTLEIMRRTFGRDDTWTVVPEFKSAGKILINVVAKHIIRQIYSG